MSVQSEITRITSAVVDSYTAVSDMGGALPISQTVGNLATAIRSIPAGGVEDHDQLNNLDYASAGHTGFQPTLVSGTNIKTINSTSLLGSGNIAVATSAQGALADNSVQLDVVPQSGAIRVTGQVMAGSFYAISLRSKKENIVPFTDSALDLIENTDIVSFNFKDDEEKNFRVGFIADDTDPVLASKNKDVMDLYNCVGVLLKAVQELSAKVKFLEKENETLRK